MFSVTLDVIPGEAVKGNVGSGLLEVPANDFISILFTLQFTIHLPCVPLIVFGGLVFVDDPSMKVS